MKDDFFTEEELREKLEELKKEIRRCDRKLKILKFIEKIIYAVWVLCGIGFVTIAILLINRARG